MDNMRTQLPAEFMEDLLLNDRIARYLQVRYPHGPDQTYVQRVQQARDLRGMYGDRTTYMEMRMWERKQS